MRMKAITLATALLAAAGPLATLHAADNPASAQHTVKGMLLEIDPANRLITVSCEPIPNYMAAMVMPFTVRDPKVLKSLHPGTNLRFSMIEQDKTDYADHIEILTATNNESESTEAAQLNSLHNAIDPTAAARQIPIGQPVPDFTLTDQLQKPTSLSQFKGKVIALTFAYSRCPNPNYCFRLSSNISRLSRRFHTRTGKDLVLLTIVIDPDNDQGKALERYAETWKADPETWHFLTGSIPQIHEVAELFGMNFWKDESFLTHTLHTVVIDRQGNLAANIEGNQFNADQLGDLVETTLSR